MNSPSLEDISKLIPLALSNALRRIDIDSLGQAMALTPAEFTSLARAISVVSQMFVDFQRDVRANPWKYDSSLPAPGDPSGSASRPDTDINVRAPGGTIEAGPVGRSSGRLTAPERMNMRLRSDAPDDVIREIPALVPVIPVMDVSHLPFLRMFKELVEAFEVMLMDRPSRLLQSHQEVRSIYGIGCERIMLTDLVRSLGVKRETLQRRVDIHLGILRDFMVQGCMALREVRCAQVITERCAMLIARLSDKPVLSHVQACWFAGVPPQRVAREQLDGYVHLLYNILGYEAYSPANVVYFSNIAFFNEAKLASLIRALREEMYDRLRPVTVEELIPHIRQRITAVPVTEQLIESLFNAVPAYEPIDAKGGTHYQIRFDWLKSFAAKAVVVLREVGKPLPFNVLLQRVNGRLAELGVDQHYGAEHASMQLHSSGLFMQLPKLGFWTLTEDRAPHNAGMMRG